MTKPSSPTVKQISRADAQRRHLLSTGMLSRMGLMPTGDPIAFALEGEERIDFYHPDRVKEAPVAPLMRKKPRPVLPPPGEDGALPLITPRRAEALGLHTKEALRRAFFEPTEPPVALLERKNGTCAPLYDRAACRRLPLPCVRCGTTPRHRAKLCLSCYKKEIALRRTAGDARRSAAYGMQKERVLFFDLELTGVFERDEILSISMINGRGETVFDSLVRPVRNKRWRRTEKIHGITPEMVKDAPTLAELTPRLAAILDSADRLVAYGTSTDFFHLRRVYATKAERDRLHGKLLDCAAEFSHYVTEHELEQTHRSLSDAMACLSLDWQGTAHTSLADTDACRRVFETLFPHFYESEIS